MTMRRIRTYHEVDAPGSAEILDQVLEQRRRLERRLASVRRVVAVASGKGGVGKSALTANLAAALAAHGHRVGALDADLNGPSLAAMLGADHAPLRVDDLGVHPALGAAGVRTISTALLLRDAETPLRWREPDDGGFVWQGALETGTLREFLADVAWGELDYLLVDMPPGTDRLAPPLLVPKLDAAILVPPPSEAARAVVARAVTLARDAGIPVIGLVANMCAFVCEGCGRATSLFPDDGARRLADAAGLPLWAEIPFDPPLAAATDAGSPPPASMAQDSPAGRAILDLAVRLEHEIRPTGGPP